MDDLYEEIETRLKSPPLPEPITTPAAGQQQDVAELAKATAALAPSAIGELIFPTFKALAQGCYLLHFSPLFNFTTEYYGTLRVQKEGINTIASGDLYSRWKLSLPWLPADPVPNPASGIPIFKRSKYAYYLRVTQILEWLTFGNSFTLGFQRYQYNHSNQTFSYLDTLTAKMSWTNAPAGYPNSSQHLTGEVKNSSGTVIGYLTMGWVNQYLRKAIVEMDRVSQSELPSNNGSGFDWQDLFNQINWQVTAYQSHTNVSEPSGQSWSDAELHSRMLQYRATSNLDNQWRYHLLCVRRLDSTSRGIMYDAFGTDSNNIPREGAGISSHWMIPNADPWGDVKGMRFGTATAPYFRTAIHEIGHALGLQHNFSDNGVMNTTNVIAASAGTFPQNIQWSFNGVDAKRLRHWPDPWVRPGMVPWGQSYASAPISPNDAIADAIEIEGLDFQATPLLGVVPLGAPVRVHVEMCNNNHTAIQVPDSLSLKSEHVTGVVTGPSGAKRSFSTVVRCVDEHNLAVLQAGERIKHDLTLLRGRDGALFSEPGMHQITVNVHWEVDGVPLKASSTCSVMVNAAQDEDHANAAYKVLSSPDALLTLAIGGDHLDEGVNAIQAALDNKTLRPHFAVVEAKRLGKRFMDRHADVEAAAALVDEQTVLSESEMRRVVEIIKSGKKTDKKEIKQCVSVLKKKSTQLSADKQIVKDLDKLA